MISLSKIVSPQFYDVHREIKNNEVDELWLKGGRGSTKSTFISIEIMVGMMADPNANAVVHRRYDNELRDSVFGQFMWSAAKLEVEDFWHFGVSPMRGIYKPTGQMIIFKGADNPRKTKSINLGKGYIKYAWFEEVDQFGGMHEISTITQSLFRGEESEDKSRIAFYSFNPPKSARSWVNQETKIQKDRRLIHHSDYTKVDPAWLGRRFIADAEHTKKVNYDRYRHEYLGEEIGTGLEVFNNITLRKITDKEIQNFDKITQGLDFGYAVDPVCFLRMYHDPKRRRVYIFFEVSGINISNRALLEKIPSEYIRTITYADSAEPKSIDELRGYGMNMRGAKKPQGSVEFGIKQLQDMEEIVIDPERCPLSAKEFTNYALDVMRDGTVKSKYPDRDNHAIDTARYALFDSFNSMRVSSNKMARSLGL